MTLKDFRELTKDMPESLEMVMDIGEGVIVTVCKQNSKVIEMQIANEYFDPEEDEEDDFYENDFLNEDDEELENVELHSVLLLMPCSCGEPLPEIGEINSQPELN